MDDVLQVHVSRALQALTGTRYPTLPGLFFTTRTLPGFFLKISGFRVATIYTVSANGASNNSFLRSEIL